MYARLCLIFSAVRDDRKIPPKKDDAQFDREEVRHASKNLL